MKGMTGDLPPPMSRRLRNGGHDEVSTWAWLSQQQKLSPRTSGRAAAQTVALLRAGREATDRVAILGLDTKAEVMLAMALTPSRLLRCRWRR